MASKAKKTAAKKPVKKVAAKSVSKKSAAKKAAPKKVAKPAVKKVAKPAAEKAVKAAPKKANAKVSKKVVVKKPAQVTAKKSTKSTPKKAIAKASVKKAPAKAVTANPVASAKPAIKNLDYSKAITPLGNRLVVRVVKGEKMTAGGLYIPDMVSDAVGHLKGEVLAVGNGSKSKKGTLRPLDVKVGDQVLFAEYAGTKVEFNAEELQIVQESDVMGIVQK